jgi:hypothetical protein
MINDKIFIEPRPRWFNLPLVIAFGFLSGYLGHAACLKGLRSFEDRLTECQKGLYHEIIKERQHIFWCSLLQGVMIAILYVGCSVLLLGRSFGYSLMGEVLAIIVGIGYLLYIVTDKKKNMLLDGNLDSEDVKDWYRSYQCMDKQFHLYFIMGFLLMGVLLYMIDIISPPYRVCVFIKAEKKNKNKMTRYKKK